MTELETLQKQHYDSYIKAIKEIVNNNTIALFDGDIASLIKKPPLDSMDQIKNKFLTLAKKESIVLETEKLNSIIQKFRINLEKSFQNIKRIRTEDINSYIDKMANVSNNTVIKITKKQLVITNSKMKKELKSVINNCLIEYIINNVDGIFVKKEEKSKIDKISREINKYLNVRGIYQKQLLESIDFKILVKDTTLINGVKEQGDRYLFTINNSRIFN